MPEPKVAIIGIIKDEAPYIKEWLAHCLSLGADHIVLFDNGSTDGTQAELAKFINHGFVTLIHFPKVKGQVDAYNYAVSVFRPHFDWLGFLDADEFVVLKAHPTIQAYLAAVPEEFDQVKLPWRVFGFSGHRTRPPGLVTDNFTMATDMTADRTQKVNCKSFVRAKAVKKFYAHAGEVGQGRTCDHNFAPTDSTPAMADPDYVTAQVNHYYTKSEEEFRVRAMRGAVSGNVRGVFGLERDHVYSVQDLAFQELWSARLKAKLAELDALPSEPTRFGLGFALPYAHHDGTFWDFERVLSNHLRGFPDNRPAFTPVKKATRQRGGLFRVPDQTPFDLLAFLDSVHYRDFERKNRSEIQSIGRPDAPGFEASINCRQARRACLLGAFQAEVEEPRIEVRIGDKPPVVIGLAGVEPGEHAFFVQLPDRYLFGFGNFVRLTAEGGRFTSFATLLHP